MILVDGACVDGVGAAMVPADDRGLHYGDGVFETLAVRDGEPEYWSAHMARLQSGCQRLGFFAPHPDVLRADAECLLGAPGIAANTGRAVLKIVVTRGSGGRGYRPPSRPEPRRVVSVHPYPLFPRDFAGEGIRLHACATVAAEHPALVGLKHLNRLPQVLARAEWDDPDVPEGLMRDVAGHPVEGTQSNLFLVRDGELWTPALSGVGVEGIIRTRLLVLARALGLTTRIDVLAADALDRADEVFVCNSLIGIWPVVSFTARRWPIGPVTRQLQQALEADRACPSG